VPIVVYRKGINPDSSQSLNEKECKKGALGVLERGSLILAKALEVLSNRE
jgi:2,3-bisphosphoglycerate-independent phosphoglycerate mutase